MTYPCPRRLTHLIHFPLYPYDGIATINFALRYLDGEFYVSIGASFFVLIFDFNQMVFKKQMYYLCNVLTYQLLLYTPENWSFFFGLGFVLDLVSFLFWVVVVC